MSITSLSSRSTPRWLLFLCVIGVFGLWGCAIPKKKTPVAPVSVPKQWNATSLRSPMNPEGWLQSFHDRHLDTIIREVMTNNYDLKISASRLNQAIAQSRITASTLYPQLSGFANTHASTATNTLSLSSYQYQLTPGNWNYAATLGLSWELDVWGKLRSLTQAAKADAAAAAFTYQGARLSLAGQAAKAWFAVLESREQIHIAEETLSALRQTYDLTKTRYDNGAVSAFDVSLSSSAATSAEANLVQKRENFAEAQRLLETILGRYPSAKLELDHAQLPKITKDVPAGLPSELLLRRPDLMVADWTLFGSENRVFSAKSLRLPNFSLTGSGGTSSLPLQNLVNTQDLIVTIAANLTQPILDGGRIEGTINLTKAQRSEAANTYARQVLVAFREVENALSNETTLKATQALQEKSLQELSIAYDVALDRYKAGQIDILSLLQTQQNMLSAQSILLTTQLQRLNNRIDLYLALGDPYDGKMS